jgi:hypothetical protein
MSITEKDNWKAVVAVCARARDKAAGEPLQEERVVCPTIVRGGDATKKIRVCSKALQNYLQHAALSILKPLLAEKRIREYNEGLDE